MKKLLIGLLTLLIVFLLVRQFPPQIARTAGIPYIPYNTSLEGARILHHRNIIRKDDGNSYDFILAGTSRTMSSFSPTSIAKELEQSCGGDHSFTGRNLGNIANYYVEFEKLLPSLPSHRYLLLEFSPHMMLGGSREYNERHDFRFFRDYRRFIREWENRLTGYFKQAIFFEERLVLNPRMMRAVYNCFVKESISLERLFILNRMNSGYGQRLQEDGQIHYYTYIPNEQVGQTIRDKRSEYRTYKRRTLRKPFSEERFAAFERIILNQERPVIVVRPPIAAELYALENEMVPDVVEMVEQIAIKHGITYIDMNPHPWYSTDMSHIDWYDTPASSRALAQQLNKLYSATSLCEAMK